MASIVSEKIDFSIRDDFKAGKHILDLVTSGMYTDPLMAIREYIQNAVDAIDEAATLGILGADQGRIDVSVRTSDRSIVILDNGVGLPEDRAIDLLGGVAISSKVQRNSRGFRGIGRLGGIGYCDSVVFETRSRPTEPVSVVTWDGEMLRCECRAGSGPNDVRRVARSSVLIVHRRGQPGESEHFFRVTMHGVHPFYKDHLMDSSALKAYLSRVAPVPFDMGEFPLAEKVEKHLSLVEGYKTYRIFVNGDQVFRPHTLSVRVNGERVDTIGDVELIKLRGRNGQEIGRGWYARMGYLAAVPRSEGMRGLRVRQGNIEVGDEHFFADFFTERRFAVWHIGEIHVSYTMRINARRDGFENSPDLEALFEQSSVLGRHLSYLCRAASKTRGRRISAIRKLERAESILHQTLFISEEHLSAAVTTARTLLCQAAADLKGRGENQRIDVRLRHAKTAMNRLHQKALLFSGALDGRKLRHIAPKDLIEQIARDILAINHDKCTAEELIAKILRPYVRSRIKL